MGISEKRREEREGREGERGEGERATRVGGAGRGWRGVATPFACVFPGLSDTFASLSPHSALSKDDLPTLERPMKASSGSVGGGREAALFAEATKRGFAPNGFLSGALSLEWIAPTSAARWWSISAARRRWRKESAGGGGEDVHLGAGERGRGTRREGEREGGRRGRQRSVIITIPQKETAGNGCVVDRFTMR